MGVEAGGLMSYGISLPERYVRAAWYVDRTCAGRTRDLPIERATVFEFVVNLKTKNTLGISFYLNSPRR
jgi:hypothetical protein